MKHRLLTFAIAFISIVNWCPATPVAPSQASEAAAKFLNAEKARWQAKPETTPARFGAKRVAPAVQAYAIKGVKEIKANTGITTAYVAELEPEGFVIISADDEIEPVLGFSFQGQFPFGESGHNALLHLVKWDMEGRLKALKEAKAKGIATKQAHLSTQKWASYLSAAKTGGAPPMTPRPMVYQQWPANQDGWLSQPTWNQTIPYNNECPYISANGTT